MLRDCAPLVGHVLAHGVGDLPLLGLGHVSAGLVRLLPAGAGDGHPDLVVALALPPVLALLGVLRAAHSLDVRLQLQLHVVAALRAVLGVALRLGPDM